LQLVGALKSNAQLYINGEPVAVEAMKDKKWYQLKFSGLFLRVSVVNTNLQAHIYMPETREDGTPNVLQLMTFEDFVQVEMNAKGSKYYDGSLGLLGRFSDGKRVARDGVTEIADVNQFGQEWQVLATEPRLFQFYAGEHVVEAPEQCRLPVSNAETAQIRRRRLAEGISQESVSEACAHVKDDHQRRACIYDVLATQNLGMAMVW
jgi:hypothetical protein